MGKRETKPLDYHACCQKIVELVEGRRTAVSAMEQLVGYLQQAHPHATWEQFLEIDFEQDLERVCKWAENLLTRSPIKEAIRVVWFEIYNPVLRGKPTADF